MMLPGETLRARILAGDEPAWLRRHTRRVYIINLALSTPVWVDRASINRLKREAVRKSRVYHTKYCVDHIVPVTHKLVCGLTVPWNLRIITRAENAKRSNRWWEWTEDLFDFPEQLRLL
jgi:hypothetical protein